MAASSPVMVGLVPNDEFKGSNVVRVLPTHVWAGLSLIGLRPITYPQSFLESKAGNTMGSDANTCRKYFSHRLQMRALASSGLLLLACASQATWAFNLGARFLARTGGRQSGLWRRPLSSSPLPDDPPFRIGHGFDIHRLEPGERPYA